MLKKINKRAWLNTDPTQAASIITIVNNDPAEFSASMRIADCYKIIDLDFSIWSSHWNIDAKDLASVKRKYKERLEKIQLLRSHMALLEEGLVAWMHNYETVHFPKASQEAKEAKLQKKDKFKNLEDKLFAINERELDNE